MRRRIRFLLFGGFVLCMAGCSLRDSKSDADRRMFSRRDAAAEARRNFANGDCRIYSAMGYAEYFPGLDFETGGALQDRFGSIVIGGTSDAIESPAHKRFIDAANAFAASYNQTMAGLVSEAGTPGLPGGGVLH